MALKPPGTRSNLDLLLASIVVLTQLALLIGGHVLLGYLVLGELGYVGGIDDFTAATGLPASAAYAILAATLALDGWILYHRRQQRIRARQR